LTAKDSHTPDKENPMKKVKLNLVGLDGNAFSLMAAFSRQARRERWTQAEIDAVLAEARKGDYQHLLKTLAAHCEG
jgi:hypothetical protein